MRPTFKVLCIAVALGSAVSAFALLPGVAVVLAPAMTAMLARATNAAVAAIGTTAVRASLPRVAAVAGVAVPVVVSRTVPRGVLLAAGLGAGVAGLSLHDAMSLANGRVSMAPGGFGFLMDFGEPPTLQMQFVSQGGYNMCPQSGVSPAAAFALWRPCALEQLRAESVGFNVMSGVVSTLHPNIPNTFSGGHFLVLWPSGEESHRVSDGQSYVQTNVLGCHKPNSGSLASNPSLCTTAPLHWQPASPAQVATRLAPYLTGSQLEEYAKDTGDAGVVIAPALVPQTTTGPATVALPQTTTTATAPDGTVTTRVVTPTANVTYQGDTVTWNISTTTTTTVAAPGVAPVVTVETTGVQSAPGAQPAPPTEEKDTCGMPGTPQCKIDEAGTPATSPDKVAEVEPLIAPLAALVAVMPALPALSWGFTLPSSCGVIPLPAFAPFLASVDVCPFQPMFHDVMTVVWVLGGLFGAIGIFWREQFAGT